MSIPKIIHYCWFGNNPLPEDAQKCIASWRKFFPDYEIIEWNEDNFDVNSIPYTAQAYSAKKYAFVSDYVRFKILYEHGGLYFDTDVEVIKPFDDIIINGGFMGREMKASEGGLVNPGLGLGVEKNHLIYRQILNEYKTFSFLNSDGTPNLKTVVSYTTEILEKFGLMATDEIEEVCGITIYPYDFFNPLDDLTGKLRITPNTHSIHWFSKSWLSVSPWRTKLSRLSHRLFGTSLTSSIRRLIKY